MVEFCIYGGLERMIFGTKTDFKKYQDILGTIVSKDDDDFSNKIFLAMTMLKNYDLASYTHSLRVGFLAGFLGYHNFMTDDEVRNLFWGGLLHDVGKLYIPLEILNKKGPLNDYEWGVMKKHSDYSAIVLEDFGVDPEIIDLAKNHHAYDSDNIYYSIITTADCVDALLTKRPYKKPFSCEKTKQILCEKHFEEQMIEQGIGIYTILFCKCK